MQMVAQKTHGRSQMLRTLPNPVQFHFSLSFTGEDETRNARRNAERSLRWAGTLLQIGRLELQGSIFVGHTAADLDSVAAAIAGAELYGGIAAVASTFNRHALHICCTHCVPAHTVD